MNEPNGITAPSPSLVGNSHKDLSLRRVLDAIPHIAWMTQPDGNMSYINARWSEYTGEAGEDRERIREAIHAEDLPWVMETMANSRVTGVLNPYKLRLRRHDGEFRWHHVQPSTLLDEQGQIEAWIGTSTDVHEEVLARAALLEREHQLRELADELELRVKGRTTELEEANRELEGFNYAIAHDLRAPIRAIIATARIVAEEAGPSLEDEHRELLDRQIKNAKHLGQLIEDLLTYSRLARMPVKQEPVDFTALATRVAETVKQERGVVTVVQEGLKTVADPGLLELVLQNLVDNAAKFSPRCTEVRIGKIDTDQGPAFFVQDQGVGFDMTFLNKLFQPFERLVRQDEFQGTGIGLANVQRVIRRHGGQVWAESEPGKGATFFFTLCPQV